uniref:Uncharacterized protein n=1 Tax=Anopheles minimus TaxID=112268 RepID=A0A182WPW5_9DIPT
NRAEGEHVSLLFASSPAKVKRYAQTPCVVAGYCS